MERFMVELEGNHHYILVDSDTGSTYYTPAQADALALAGMLNSREDLNRNQKSYIDFLIKKLESVGVTDIEQPKNCLNCGQGSVALDGVIYCELRERDMSKSDYCNKWVSD